jgi:hypothetical protein
MIGFCMRILFGVGLGMICLEFQVLRVADLLSIASCCR